MNNQNFEEKISLIYPPEITCNREKITDISGHFLEIDISIESEKFRTKLFDKRDDFLFYIIPDNIVYNVFFYPACKIYDGMFSFSRLRFLLETLLQNFIS